MKLFSLVFISAALGLTTSILLYKVYKIDISPLFTGLFFNAIGYQLFKTKLNK
jgi:hypothetical protein